MSLTRRLLLGGVGSLPLVRVARGATAARVTILHYNDVHSRHLAVNGRALTCTGRDGAGGDGCFGGSARLAGAIAEQRAAARGDGRMVLLLDAGDQFQGSLFYTAHRGAAELAVQHANAVDAMAVGNHEFDNGPETLQRYVEAARFPVLAANLDLGDEPRLRGLVRPWAVLEREGLRVGVVGLTTPDAALTSSPGPNVRFLPPRPALAEAVRAVRAEGAGLVVALSHLGLVEDRTLEGVDVVVGGHSHTLLSNTEPNAEGAVPQGGLPGPLIVQAGAFGRYLGRLDLDLDAAGRVVAYAAAVRHVGLDVAEDAGVAAIVAGFAAPLEALRRQVVARLPGALEIGACRVAGCALGIMVAEAQRGALAGMARASARPVVGLLNAGGLRTGLPAGEVTRGQVLDAMPFGNTLVGVEVDGAALEAAARHGLTMAGRGGFPQWAGLRLQVFPPAVEVEAPAGWAALEAGGRYLLATNSFVASGGDGYAMLRGAKVTDTGLLLADLLADALGRG